MNQTTLAEATETCDSDYACVFDLIATGDEKFAKYSKDANLEANDKKNSQSMLSITHWPGMSNLASKLGYICPKWDKSGTF